MSVYDIFIKNAINHVIRIDPINWTNTFRIGLINWANTNRLLNILVIILESTNHL